MIHLVSGGAGLIGSYIIDDLLKNNKVICIDNFSTGNKKNIIKWLKDDRFKLIEQDITRPIDLEVDEFGILHVTSPTKYKIDPIIYFPNIVSLGLITCLN